MVIIFRMCTDCSKFGGHTSRSIVVTVVACEQCIVTDLIWEVHRVHFENDTYNGR